MCATTGWLVAMGNTAGMDRVEALPRVIAEVARSLQAETGAGDTMDLAVSLALDVVDGGEHAGISMVYRSGLVETPAFTDDRVLRADQIQHELGEGPGMTAVRDEHAVSCPDLAAEPRWGKWGLRTSQET